MQSAPTYSLLNPFDWYAAMRETRPVFKDPRFGGWSVFRYEDVQRVLSESATFSSAFGGTDPLGASIIATDPPRHRQLRTLVTQAFTPRAIARLTERIGAIVAELLDPISAVGTLDVVDDLAYPLPVIVIAEMLGIPRADRAQFKAWSDAIVGTGERRGDPQAEMGRYFAAIIAQRKAAPEDDLISALLAAQIDGEHLTGQEILGFCILLLVAGNETTTNLIGNAMVCLDAHPDAADHLRANPDAIPAAIEEVLRYLSPIQHMFRRTVSETTIGGQRIPANQGVVAWIGSANRDAAQFPDPTRFDISRDNPRHIAFGYGIHYCLGAPLARLEAKIALGALFERFGAMRRVPGVELEALGSQLVYGVKHLPMTVTPHR